MHEGVKTLLASSLRADTWKHPAIWSFGLGFAPYQLGDIFEADG